MPRYLPVRELEKVNESSILFVKIGSKDMAMFRFLLEAYDGLAMMTIIEPKTTLVKILYSPHEELRLFSALEAMRELISIENMVNPF